MAEKMKPASKQQAPDPAKTYERSHPRDEAGMGQLENNKSTPIDRPDQAKQAVKNRRDQSKGRRNRP